MTDDSLPADHVLPEENGDGETVRPIEQHFKSKSTWLRLVFMLLFCVLASVASMVGSVVILLGFFWVLFTGETNEHLRRLGQGIASYIYQIIQYLTYNSDERPFPFDAGWPGSDVGPKED